MMVVRFSSPPPTATIGPSQWIKIKLKPEKM
ncbi:MAG: hypothetical protein MRERV_27c019 [Mycoplasmataceae bacterium RV_VA103A]|nr:MAG: hypothetical protein MRERV_27c019 [Mycoplasmataceae bacterium RV_VA103A]